MADWKLEKFETEEETDKYHKAVTVSSESGRTVITYKQLQDDLNGHISQACSANNITAPEEIENLTLALIDFMTEIETDGRYSGWRNQLIINKAAGTVSVGDVTLGKDDIKNYFEASMALLCDNAEDRRLAKEKAGLAYLLKEFLKG